MPVHWHEGVGIFDVNTSVRDVPRIALMSFHVSQLVSRLSVTLCPFGSLLISKYFLVSTVSST